MLMSPRYDYCIHLNHPLAKTGKLRLSKATYSTWRSPAGSHRSALLQRSPSNTLCPMQTEPRLLGALTVLLGKQHREVAHARLALLGQFSCTVAFPAHFCILWSGLATHVPSHGINCWFSVVVTTWLSDQLRLVPLDWN